MLKQLFDKYNCDKARKHHYHLIYEAEFEARREEPLNILEVGVFKGESTAAWVDYFPNATIYGLDIFTRVKMTDIPILKHKRVKAHRGDSTDVTITREIEKKWPWAKFDIIIDDGLHTPRANADTFTNLIGLMKPDGAFYIEDAWPLDKMTTEQLRHPWIAKHPERYNALEMEYFLGKVDNGNYRIERFDNRKLSGEPDSYIFKVTNA
jgi:hypothetical protein